MKPEKSFTAYLQCQTLRATHLAALKDEFLVIFILFSYGGLTGLPLLSAQRYYSFRTHILP